MFKDMSRVLTLLCGVSGAVLTAPAEGQAFWNWFKKQQCACQPTTTSYYLAAPATQACQYVPQTAYRVNYVTVPVTTYRPVIACDACGQQIVSMRPLIAYTRQAQVVPYQNYRLACSAAPVATAAYLTPSIGYGASTVNYAAPSTGTSCCNGGTSSLQPGASYAGPAYSSVAPGGTISSDSAATIAPSLSPGYAPNGTTAIQGSSSYTPGYPAYSGYPYSTYPSNTYPQSTYPQSSTIQQAPPASMPLSQNSQQETHRHTTNGTQSPAPVSPAPASPPSGGDPAALVPIPDHNTNGGGSSSSVNGVESSQRGAGPMIPDPESRSTQRPSSTRWWAYSPVSMQSAAQQNAPAAQPPKAPANDGGWRSSKR